MVAIKGWSFLMRGSYGRVSQYVCRYMYMYNVGLMPMHVSKKIVNSWIELQKFDRVKLTRLKYLNQ